MGLTDPDCDLLPLSRRFYLWDNWVVWCDQRGSFYRYMLAAPREGPPEARHARARIRAATSKDGARWRDEGEALAPGAPGALDELAVWTGATIIAGGAFWLFYTGVSGGDRLDQAIALASSEGGVEFEKRPEPVLAPQGSRAAELGYDTGDADGLVRAWRDPHVQRDPATGAWHMVFAAKRAGPAPRGAIGHAVAEGGDFGRWALRPPLDLPERFAQMEVPSLIFAGGRVYVFVSTKARDREDTEEAEAAWRAYAAPSPEGPWSRAAARPLVAPQQGVYGARAFWGPRGLYASAFYALNHPAAFSPAPIVPLGDGSAADLADLCADPPPFGRSARIASPCLCPALLRPRRVPARGSAVLSALVALGTSELAVRGGEGARGWAPRGRRGGAPGVSSRGGLGRRSRVCRVRSCGGLAHLLLGSRVYQARAEARAAHADRDGC